MEQLLAQLTALDQSIDALLVHEDLTAEQRAEHDRLVAQRGKLVAKIAQERARLARAEERAQLEATVQQGREGTAARAATPPANPGRLTDPDPATNGRRAAVVEPPQPAIVIHATARRGGRLMSFREEVEGVRPEQRAYAFGMWGLAMLAAQFPHRFRFDHASEWARARLAAAKSTDGDGTHYLIPEQFGADLIVLREQYGKARQLFRPVPMIADTRTDPRRQGGLTAYFYGEGEAITESKQTWDRVRLTAKDLGCIARVTAQVNEDVAINFGDELMSEIAYAFSAKEDSCAFNGDGTSTYGHIQGVRHALANTGTAGLVTQGTGNTWSALVLADFDGVVGLLPEYADTDACAWLMHRTFYYTIVEKLVTASGGAPAYEVRQGQRGRPLFKGYPVVFSQAYPNATATSSVVATLGDYGLGASFGDRQQMSIRFSEDATVGGESVFERNEIAVRGTERIDINVHDCGSSTTPGPIVGLKTGA